MQPLKNFAIPSLLIALLVFPLTTSSQNQEPSPPRGTSRSEAPQGSRRPETKFRKVQKPIPNRYIVILNNDVADDVSPREVRLERVREIANGHALAHTGRVDQVYETAVKGYAIELPNEAAAVAISNRPEVQWVEEDEYLQVGQAPASPQPSPAWGLDAIDGTLPTAVPDATGRTNGFYNFNATGTGVVAYVLDTGINTAHQEFFLNRATQAADCIRNNDCRTGPATPFLDGACGPGMPNTTNNDCHGHGTHVAGTIGGNMHGVAKGVSIRSVKVCVVPNITMPSNCPASVIIQGVNWVTSDHQANPSVPKVVNMSLAIPNSIPFDPVFFNQTGIRSAVNFSSDRGVTYVISAGNSNDNAANYHPGDIEAALTVGAVDSNGNRASFSNWGPGVDIWAPGVLILSAQTSNQLCLLWNGSNTSECRASGTSMAAPHVAGAVAMYLQGRTGVTGCSTFPVTGTALNLTQNFSTCPDRVTRFIKAISNLDRLTNISPNPTFPSPNRFLWNIFIPTNANPIDNQRFFVWMHYPDFLVNRPEPDEGGLNHWTNNITGPCATNINQNNACTREWRIHTSRAFWVARFPTLFNPQTGGTTNNTQFVTECYRRYLRREPDASGLQHWVNDLNQYGNPASYEGVNHLIDAFLLSPEYRRRFGP